MAQKKTTTKKKKELTPGKIKKLNQNLKKMSTENFTSVNFYLTLTYQII